MPNQLSPVMEPVISNSAVLSSPRAFFRLVSLTGLAFYSPSPVAMA